MAAIGTRAVVGDPMKKLRRTKTRIKRRSAPKAVIAIENTQLLNELRQRTDDLQQIAATTDGHVRGPWHHQQFAGGHCAGLEAIVESAARLCEAENASIYRTENDCVRHEANHGRVPLAVGETRPLAPGSMAGQVIINRKTVHFADALAVAATMLRDNQAAIERQGIRTVLGVPLMRGETALGAIVLRRTTVRPFSGKQIELIENFAAQAVIAIENTRLLNELRQRTGDLSKSLEDLRTAQDRLVQTEKFASLGQLTAGIAHEIKNPLNFVNNFSEVSVELIDELRVTLQNVRPTIKLPLTSLS